MGRPIVVFGDDWDRHVSSMQHVFRPIMRERPVVWVNAIGHRIPRFQRADLRRAWEKTRAMVRAGGWAGERAERDGCRPLVVIEPRVLPWHHRAVVHAYNTWSLVRDVRVALRRQGFSARPIVVTGSPPSVGVIGRLDEIASVYFCMDDFRHLAGVSAEMIEPLERRMLDAVDAVVATAKSLTRSKVPRSGRIHYLPQGVNFSHFATPRPEPSDLKAIPRPRIGFAGGVSACCDLELLRRVASAFPNASLVLVGPVSVDIGSVNVPNLHVLGPRSYQELPAYVQHFDVGMIPYVLNDWTVAVDPLKLLEYLAAGIPVVSSGIPEVEKYREAVFVAADHGDFVRGVGRALAEDKMVARRRGQAVASMNTWEQRAGDLLSLLDDVAGGAHADVHVTTG